VLKCENCCDLQTTLGTVFNIYCIIRPHCSITNIDAAYCNRVVSVSLSVTVVSPAKTAELIEMPFGLRTRVDAGNLIRWDPDPPMGRGNFKGGRGIPL